MSGAFLSNNIERRGTYEKERKRSLYHNPLIIFNSFYPISKIKKASDFSHL